MSAHTSFRVGGPARCYSIPETPEELVSLIRFLYEKKLPYEIIGNGTNLLVSDAGIECTVIEVGRSLEGIRRLPNRKTKAAAPETGDNADTVRIRVMAGTLLARAAVYACENSLSGMEALRGIPGTVGGAVTMNAGAYGTEIRDILESVEVVTRRGSVKTVKAEDLQLGYRHSIVPEKGYIVLSAVFRLKKDPDRGAIAGRMQEFMQKRAEKQPLDKPSAGSTFKRPEGCFAGKLIEDAGLKGFRIGGAEVSGKHAGFVVNADGEASAWEVYELISEVQRRVLEASGVRLEPEVKFLGNFDADEDTSGDTVKSASVSKSKRPAEGNADGGAV